MPFLTIITITTLLTRIALAKLLILLKQILRFFAYLRAHLSTLSNQITTTPRPLRAVASPQKEIKPQHDQLPHLDTAVDQITLCGVQVVSPLSSAGPLSLVSARIPHTPRGTAWQSQNWREGADAQTPLDTLNEPSSARADGRRQRHRQLSQFQIPQSATGPASLASAGTPQTPTLQSASWRRPSSAEIARREGGEAYVVPAMRKKSKGL